MINENKIQKIKQAQQYVEIYREQHNNIHKKYSGEELKIKHNEIYNQLINSLKNIGYDGTPKEIFEQFSLDCEMLAHYDENILNNEIRKNRKDLLMIAGTTDVKGIIKEYKGAVVKSYDYFFGKEIGIFINDFKITDTSLLMHKICYEAIKYCPDDAIILIGGLGLGIILLYLLEYRNPLKIVVYEIDDRIIYLFNHQKSWLEQNYSANLEIIHGDVLNAKIIEKYDWIFFGIDDKVDSYTKNKFKQYLTEGNIIDYFDIHDNILKTKWLP